MLCALFYKQVREFRCLELDMQLRDRDDSVRNYAYLRTICVNAITTWRRRRNQEKMYSATRSTSAQRRYAAPAHGSRRRSTSRSKRGSRFPGRRNSRRGSPHRKTSHGARRRDVGLLADSRGVPRQGCTCAHSEIALSLPARKSDLLRLQARALQPRQRMQSLP